MSDVYTPEEEYIHKLESDLGHERALVEKLRKDTAPAVKERREAYRILIDDGWDMGSGWDLPGVVAALLEQRDTPTPVEAEVEKLTRERDEARAEVERLQERVAKQIAECADCDWLQL